MIKPRLSWFYNIYALCIVLAMFCEISHARRRGEATLKSAIFHSPEFVLQPGSVANKFFFNVDFPRNHIGIKSFDAEVVDDAGVSIPLHETYLHHWLIVRYFQRTGTRDNQLDGRDSFLAGNSGVCNNLGQYFGLGSETRKTETHVPDPYAMEVGNPAEVPAGYEEKWLLNVHAIDTRHAVDKLGCTECKCSLYNVTVDEFDRPLRPDYDGGLLCCYDKTQCKVKQGFEHSPRKLYLRYTVKWVDWDTSFIPVRIYIFDITDTLRISEDSADAKHHCQIEYEVEPCKASVMSNELCVNNKKLTFRMPRGGYLIYGVAHQHSGGVGSALYRQDGEVLCPSMPLYGNGNEVGNEEGYIVGMSTCYPKPGSITIEHGEILVLESNYSSSRKHTGVMGLFYILVADELPPKTSFLDAVISKVDDTHLPISTWIMLITGIVAVATFAAAGFRRRGVNEDGYQPVSM